MYLDNSASQKPRASPSKRGQWAAALSATTRSTPEVVIPRVRGLNAPFKFGCPRFPRLSLGFYVY